MNEIPDLGLLKQEHAERTVVALVTLLFLCQLLLGFVLIPPWQGPDEPQHVLLVSILANGADATPHLEEDLVGSMTRHRWWYYYGYRQPERPPRTIAESPVPIADIAGGAVGGPQTYYATAAAMLRRLEIGDIEQRYFFLRAWSTALGIATVLLLWRANRKTFGPAVALLSMMIVALDPQFVLMSLTAGPDSSVVFLGAAFWMCCAWILADEHRVVALLGAWICAILAVSIRRVGAPLAVDAFLVTYWCLTRKPTHRPAAALCAALVLVTTVVAYRFAPQGLARLVANSADGSQVLDAVQQMWNDPSYINGVALGVFRSIWLVAGWMRFEAPPLWYLCFQVLCLAGGLGFLLRCFDRTQKALWIPGTMELSAAIVLIQILAIVASFAIRNGAQGRYLMPAAAPLFGMLAAGLLAWIPPSRQWTGAIAMGGCLGVLGAAGWLLVLLPTYAGGF